MTTMRQVAARAGVSAKTVSRVFNDDPHVLPETRAHVEGVMRELNYVPNGLATTFRAGRTSTIGVAVPDVVDPFFAEIARAVDRRARSRGSATLLAGLGDHPDSEREILESLLSRRLSGLVVAPVGTDHEWLKRWRDSTPIVFVDRAPVGLVADTFRDDDEAGGYLATSHLAGHGHRRIAFVGDMGHLSTEINRLAGYRRALSEAGIAPDDALVLSGVNDRDSAGSAVARLGALADPPSAVFSANARTSMSLVPAVSAVSAVSAPAVPVRRGASRRRRLAVVGFGDFPMADMLQPALTVIDQDPQSIGERAAERVFDRLAHPARRFRRLNVLEVTLVERQSCQ